MNRIAIKPNSEKPCYICVIGGPGSGKTTQSGYICDTFLYEYISTGQLLRQAIASQRIPNLEDVQNRMKDGRSIDTDIFLKSLSDAIDRKREKHIVFDGFPVNEDNYETWKANFKDKFKAIFYLEITEDEMKKRLLKRNLREDDNEISIRNRIKTFNFETKPLIDYLRNMGRITIFDGMKTKTELRDEIQSEIKSRVLHK